jgi:hypothetical protein
LISSTISAYFYKSTCLLLEPGLKHASGLMDESGLGGLLGLKKGPWVFLCMNYFSMTLVLR